MPRPAWVLAEDRTCDKCPKEVRVAVTERLAFNGSRFEIDLCEKHSNELFSDMMAWLDLGTKTGESKFEQSVLAKEVRVNLDPPKFPLARAAEPEQPAASTPVAAVTPLRKHLAGDPNLPMTAARWIITHAEQRRELRQFSLAEVLWACERPETSAQQARHHSQRPFRGQRQAGRGARQPQQCCPNGRYQRTPSRRAIEGRPGRHPGLEREMSVFSQEC